MSPGTIFTTLFLSAFSTAGDPPAGYRGGLAPPHGESTVSVADFGAVPDDGADDTEAFKKALEEVMEAGGVVSIPSGRFVLTGPLIIHGSDVVLRGAGSAATVLECPLSLTEMFGENRNWSWSGAMVKIEPSGGETTVVASIERNARRGIRQIVFQMQEGVEPPVPGSFYEMQWFNDSEDDSLLADLYGGVIPRKLLGKELQASTSARVRRWVEVNRVTRLSRGKVRVTLALPLPIDARLKWKVVLVDRPHVTGSGVEGLTFEFPKTEYPGHLKEKGYNAVAITSAVNCWVRDVHTENADSGVFCNLSKYVTVDGFNARGKKMHHVLSASWSTECLFTNWEITAPHVHGTTVSWAAHHNVFSNGKGVNLAMDCHRAAPFENVHRNLVIEHDGAGYHPLRSGGSYPRGPHSGRSNEYRDVEFVFSGGEGPYRISGLGEWPRAIFDNWHGNRPVVIEPVEGLKQIVR